MDAALNPAPVAAAGTTRPAVFRKVYRWPLLILVLVGSLGVLRTHQVELRCTRDHSGTGNCDPRLNPTDRDACAHGQGTGVCAGLDQHSFWSDDPVRVDVPDLLDARRVTGLFGTSHVALVAKSSTRALSSSNDLDVGGAQQAMVDAVEHFVHDAKEPVLEAAYGRRWPSRAFWIVLGGLAVLFLLGVWSVRLVVDTAAGEIRVIRSRLPLPSRVERFPLAQLSGATADTGVTLVLKDSRSVTVLQGGSVVNDRAVAAIQAALKGSSASG